MVVPVPVTVPAVIPVVVRILPESERPLPTVIFEKYPSLSCPAMVVEVPEDTVTLSAPAISMVPPVSRTIESVRPLAEAHFER